MTKSSQLTWVWQSPRYKNNLKEYLIFRCINDVLFSINVLFTSMCTHIIICSFQWILKYLILLLQFSMTLLRISILLHFPRSWQAISATKIRELRRTQSSFQVPSKQKSKKTYHWTTAASWHHTKLPLRAWTCTVLCTLDLTFGVRFLLVPPSTGWIATGS